MGDSNSFFEQLKQFLDKEDLAEESEATVVSLRNNKIKNPNLLKRLLEDGKAFFKTDYNSTDGVFYALRTYVEEQGKV